MALRTCPDCNKEVSTSADACPNCGHPFKTEPVVNKTVVTPTPEPDNSVPKWVIFPVAIIGVLLLFALIYMFQNSNDANENLSVDVTAEKQSNNDNQTVVQSDPTPDNIQIPADIPPSTDVTIPKADNQQTVPPNTKTEIVDNSPDKGKVELEAKVADKNGKVSAVEDEKFYLLDKDLESILREAKLQSIQNQNLINSFGLSVLNPGKYKEFNEKALSAINAHVKYDALTTNGGKATLSDVEPKKYYLFGIHKVGNGFAIWNSTVNIKSGQNTLKIQPQRLTEVNE